METEVLCFLEYFIGVYGCTMLYIVSSLFSYLHCLIMSHSIPTLTIPPRCLGVNKTSCTNARGWGKHFSTFPGGRARKNAHSQ